MTKNKTRKPANKPAKQEPATTEAIAPVETASNVIPLTPQPAQAAASGGEPPQSALHAKVLAYCERIREATTTELHLLAVECLKHGAPNELGGHGDLRPLLALQNNLPRSIRKVELMAWAQAFAPIDWGKRDKSDNADGIKLAKQGSKHFKPWNLDGAAESPFYLKPEAVKPKGITDAVKQLLSQNATYEKMLADPRIVRKDGVTDDGLRAAIAVNKRMIAASQAA